MDALGFLIGMACGVAAVLIAYSNGWRWWSYALSVFTAWFVSLGVMTLIETVSVSQ